MAIMPFFPVNFLANLMAASMASAPLLDMCICESPSGASPASVSRNLSRVLL